MYYREAIKLQAFLDMAENDGLLRLVYYMFFVCVFCLLNPNSFMQTYFEVMMLFQGEMTD